LRGPKGFATAASQGIQAIPRIKLIIFLFEPLNGEKRVTTPLEFFLFCLRNKVKKMRSTKHSEQGAADLFKILQNYQRITLTEACGHLVKEGDLSIGIWVNKQGKWWHDTKAEQKLAQLKFQSNTSVCKSIVTQLYGLSTSEYQKIRVQFDDQLSESWAGVYEARDERQPKFLLVVRLPEKIDKLRFSDSRFGSAARAGGVGAAGVLTGAAIVGLAAKNVVSEQKRANREQLEAKKTELAARHSEELASTTDRANKLAAEVSELMEKNKKLESANKDFQLLVAGQAAEVQDLKAHQSNTLVGKAAQAASVATGVGATAGSAAVNAAGNAAAALVGKAAQAASVATGVGATAGSAAVNAAGNAAAAVQHAGTGIFSLIKRHNKKK
jgi:hypothetical protein